MRRIVMLARTQHNLKILMNVTDHVKSQSLYQVQITSHDLLRLKDSNNASNCMNYL